MPHTRGITDAEDAVVGTSGTGRGVVGQSGDQAGVLGVSERFVGIWGEGKGEHPGVLGTSVVAPGVSGTSTSQVGGIGVSQDFVGVWGESSGQNSAVLGTSTAGAGVRGTSIDGPGMRGESVSQAGVVGVSQQFVGVWGEGQGDHPAIFGVGRTAGHFEGNVVVTGDIQLPNADCPEDFDVIDVDLAAPGTVMVLNEAGQLRPSFRAYDRCVAGVVSGAGSYRPGIVLDRVPGETPRRPIALLGKVYCNVDASFGPILVGDLLTTSPTPDHAMRASDPAQAFGAVIGKALRPLADGQGLLPILIALQ